MANDSAKKTLRKNSRILGTVRVALMGALAVYLPLVYTYRDDATAISVSVSVAHYSLAVAIYQMFRHLSRERYDSTGRLIDGGSELSGTVINVAFDVLYVVLLVFTLSPVTVKIYWADLLIPIPILYGFWSVVIKPMMHFTDMQETATRTTGSHSGRRERKRYKY
ncbi:Hypothetical protein GLP15_3423 [Giardia lamblia P15]|uniref:Uncharacterized protein n=1 Tax=Giardia intestinalis (strain P15) TaxID=658858 RepID=E1F3K3_GIAIA|nr:Hypothetical protein GLP15_3423 [Giardia lamblia P15]